jgi:hypothetical protein
LAFIVNTWVQGAVKVFESSVAGVVFGIDVKPDVWILPFDPGHHTRH